MTSNNKAAAVAAATLCKLVNDEIEAYVRYATEGSNLDGAVVEVFLVSALKKSIDKLDKRAKEVIKEAYDMPAPGAGKTKIDEVNDVTLSVTVSERKGSLDESKLYALMVDEGIDRTTARRVLNDCRKPATEVVSIHAESK